MSFAAGAAVGEQARRTNYPMSQLKLPSNPGATFAALQRPPAPSFRGGGGGRRQEGGMDPGGIHRRAAEMVLQEKELNNQKLALEIEGLREANKLRSDERRRAVEREPFEKSAMIEGQYRDRLGSIAGQEELRRGGEAENQAKDFKAAMLGAHMGDGEAVKNFINRYGDTKANVTSVEFAPDGSGETIVTYEDGKKSFFKSPEQLYKGLLFWMDPSTAKAMSEKGKGGADDDKTVRTRNTIWKGLDKQYNDEFSDPMGRKSPDAPEKDAWMREQYKSITGKDWDSELQEKGEGAIQSPKTVSGDKSGDKSSDKSGAPPVEGARKAPDGKWYVQKDGKWHQVLEKGQSAGTTKERAKGEETFDYGTGKGPLKGHPSTHGAERVRGTIEKPGSEAEGSKKKVGSTTFTDPNTGERVTRTYFADGTHSETKEKKRKGKKEGSSED